MSWLNDVWKNPSPIPTIHAGSLEPRSQSQYKKNIIGGRGGLQPGFPPSIVLSHLVGIKYWSRLSLRKRQSETKTEVTVAVIRAVLVALG